MFLDILSQLVLNVNVSIGPEWISMNSSLVVDSTKIKRMVFQMVDIRPSFYSMIFMSFFKHLFFIL